MAQASTAVASPGKACPYLRAGEAAVTSPAAAEADAARGAGAVTEADPVIWAGAVRRTHADASTALGCTAGRDPYSPGPRQRALVCDTARFASCPRFPAAERRGIERRAASARAPAPWATAGGAEAGRASRLEAMRGVPLPTAVAGVILVLALVAAFAFTAARGSLDLAAAPGVTASPSPSAAASAGPSSAVTPGPTAAPSTLGPAPTPTPASAPPVPTATAISSVRPVPTATAGPPDPRYAGLKPCLGQADCYLYVVRRGDTLSSIARSFGVSLATVRALNKDLADPSIIHVGQKIRIPGQG